MLNSICAYCDRRNADFIEYIVDYDNDEVKYYKFCAHCWHEIYTFTIRPYEDARRNEEEYGFTYFDVLLERLSGKEIDPSKIKPIQNKRVYNHIVDQPKVTVNNQVVRYQEYPLETHFCMKFFCDVILWLAIIGIYFWWLSILPRAYLK